MGPRVRGRFRKSKGGERKPRNDERSTQGYTKVVRDNEQFKNYYKSQNILSEEEFEEFYKVLQTALPTTFRITGSRNNAIQLRDVIENGFVPKMQNVVVDGESFDPPRPLEWYPDRFGWQVNASRAVFRRSPAFSKFHKFLVTETEAASGNVSRQEAVSMVPPLLMDIQPDQWVLDMCAAPGSKTAQIIEAIHGNGKVNDMPTGLVVANDADYKRSHMLVHQTKRLQSPCFIATNHDASQFPNIHLPNAQGQPVAWQFDRVLCDVPCSGDGTIRKNEGIWKQWGVGPALGLHSLQVQIFLRGAQLTKLGGRIVYSTCSFNPVENEAVVAEVLRLADGALVLKDVSDQLPKLKRKPGLTSWKIMTATGQYISSLNDIENDRARRKFPASVFPPANAKDLHLERCLRIYPHQQDTGGFFVAVFEKVKPMTAADFARSRELNGETMNEDALKAAEAHDESLLKSVQMPEDGDDEQSSTDKTENPVYLNEEEATATETVPLKRQSSTEDVSAKGKKARKDVPQMKEAPFDLMSTENPDINAVSNFFGIDPAFPRDQYILRSEDNAKNRTIYFVSKSVKAVLESADSKRLHIVNTGVRLFVRQGSMADHNLDHSAPFRLTNEGLPLLERVLTDDRRRIEISFSDLKVLLTEAMPKLDAFAPTLKEKLEKMESGSCILYANITHPPFENTFYLSMPVWKGKASVNVLINKQDKRSLYERFFGFDAKEDQEHDEKEEQQNDNQETEA